jgi:hypothetical protein
VGAREAKRLLERLEGTSFGPEALKIVGRAFDEAWSDIAGNFGDAAQIEIVRSKLARAILSAASDNSRDVAALKRIGLEAIRN